MLRMRIITSGIIIISLKRYIYDYEHFHSGREMVDYTIYQYATKKCFKYKQAAVDDA